MNIVGNNKSSKILNIGVYFFFLIFISLCFIPLSIDEDLNVTSNLIYVPHLSVKLMYIIIIICAIFILLSLFKKIYINGITVALILNLVLGLIPILYANKNSYWGNYFVVIISLVSYYVCSNTRSDFVEKLYKIVCIICVIISIQVIFTEFSFFSNLSISNINNVVVKAYMKIPIGGSNKIAAYLLPMMVFIMTYRRNKKSLFIVALTTYAIILCRSKNALGIIALLIIYILFKKIYNFILRDKSVDKKSKLIVFLVVSIILGLLSILMVYFVLNVMSKITFDSYNSPYTGILKYIDALSSGRIVIFTNELKRFSQHIFLGNGFGYELGYARSHNWFIEVLAQRGITGLFLYSYCLLKAVNISKKYKNDRFINASRYLLAVVFIQGLFEITVFTIGIDFMIWSIVGFIVARVVYLDNISCNYEY